MTETLITTGEICEKYRISKGMVHKLRHAGMPYISIGRCIRYSMVDVDAWIAERQDAHEGYDPLRAHEREALIEDIGGSTKVHLRQENE